MDKTSAEPVEVSAQDGEQGTAATASPAENRGAPAAVSPNGKQDAAAGNGAQPVGTPSFWTLEPIPGVVDACLLGWKIVELRDRVRVAAALTEVLREPRDGAPVPDRTDPAAEELGDPIWMTSIWHADLKQIAATHSKEFPDALTSGTLYEPPGGHWDHSIPYLYPQLADQSNDYTAIGIGPGAIGGVTIPQGFSIYDVTRRGINALAILYARSKDNLIETTIEGYQTTLFQQMSAAGSLDGEVPATTPEAHEKLRRAAVATLTTAIDELLDDWASFLREQYYAGATSPSGATKLQAFEAGRHLARLTWSISAKTIGLEMAGKSAAEVLAVWQSVFKPYEVVQAQHFITALCGAMDDQYRQAFGTAASTTDANTASSSYDPDLPNSMGTAIARCLDHWHAGVVWLGKQPELHTDFYKRLRLGLIQQSDIWQSLLTGRVRLGLFTVESVMSRLAQEALNDIQEKVEADAARAAKEEAERDVRAWLHMLGPAAWLIVAGIGMAVLFVAITIVLVIFNPTANGAWAALSIGSVGAWAAALLGLRGTAGSAQSAASSQPAGNKSGATVPTGLVVRVNDTVHLIEASASSGFKAAYAQLRLELAGLNYATGVSYPLIEAFVMHREPDEKTPEINVIKDDYTFMRKVIWTTDERREEVEDIVRAALGPAGLLSGIAVRKKSTGDDPSRAATPLK